MGFKADTSLSEIQQAIPNSGLLSASTSDNIYDQVTSIGLVALENGLINETVFVSLVIIALVTSMTSGPLMKWALK